MLRSTRFLFICWIFVKTVVFRVQTERLLAMSDRKKKFLCDSCLVWQGSLGNAFCRKYFVHTAHLYGAPVGNFNWVGLESSTSWLQECIELYSLMLSHPPQHLGAANLLFSFHPDVYKSKFRSYLLVLMTAVWNDNIQFVKPRFEQIRNLRCLLRKFECNVFSIIHVNGHNFWCTWTDFKKIKFCRQHRYCGIIFRGQAKNGSFVTMETVTF